MSAADLTSELAGLDLEAYRAELVDIGSGFDSLSATPGVRIFHHATGTRSCADGLGASACTCVECTLCHVHED